LIPILEQKKKNYALLKQKKYELNDYSLVSIRKTDIQLIRKWRNDQIDVLRQTNFITKNEQEKYYNTVIQKTFSQKKPDMILFSFMLKKKCIGYGGFVHIDWKSKRSEISFITQTERNIDKKIYATDFKAFFNLIFQIGFNELEFNKLTTETFDIRPYVIELLENTHFKLEGRLKQHVLIKDFFVDSLVHGCLRKHLK